MRSRRAKRAFALGCVVLLLLFPFAAGNERVLHVLTVALLFAILASSWDMTLGYAGVFNFAHVAIFAVGAYTTAILRVRIGIDPWIALGAGAGAALIANVVLVVPAMRLRGFYVALLTFAMAQIVFQLIISNSGLTGGYEGLVGLPSLSLFGVAFNEIPQLYYYLVVVVALFSLLALMGLSRSRIGLSLCALRDAEAYAAARGLSIVRLRTIAFAVSGLAAGLAGGLYASYNRAVSPELLGFSFTTMILSMVLVGGIGTVAGPFVAAIAITILSELLAPFGPLRLIAIALLIMFTILLTPSGLWGGVEAVRDRWGAVQARRALGR